MEEGSQDAPWSLAGYHLPVRKGRYLGQKSWDSVCNYQRTISMRQEGLSPSVLVSPGSIYSREFNHHVLSKHPEVYPAPWKRSWTQNTNHPQEEWPRGVAVCTACILWLPQSEVQTTADGSCIPGSPSNINSHYSSNERSVSSIWSVGILHFVVSKQDHWINRRRDVFMNKQSSDL